MNLLKREVPVRTDHLRESIRFFDRFCLIGLMISAIWAVSMTIGIRIGHDQAQHEMLMGHEPVIAETDACGISDPLACAVQIAQSVAEAFNPMPEFTVTVIEGTVTTCKDIEAAYDACLADDACDVEKLGPLAQDLVLCTPVRR